MNQERANKRTLKGTVVSDRPAKTVVVRVDRTKVHPMYKKRYITSRTYKAHDPKDEYHIDDFVLIEETRPISKDKRWRVVKKLS